VYFNLSNKLKSHKIESFVLSPQRVIEGFVTRYLAHPGKCWGHCEEHTKFKKIYSDEAKVVGAYVCPGGFVSRIGYYSLFPNLTWFIAFLQGRSVAASFREEDFRVATRHPWELSAPRVWIRRIASLMRASDMAATVTASHAPYLMKTIYWSPPHGSEKELKGVFICKQCESFFLQPKTSRTTICSRCR